MLGKNRSLAASRVHFIGIGGIGMSGLAELLCNMGARVSGSDLSENAQTAHLKSLGVDIRLGHAAINLEGCDVVVYSSAVRATNPEYSEALRLKVPLIPRAEALAEVMRLSRGIAVGGSHGKTTTTSLLASIFIHAKKEPTICVGGRLDLIQSTARLGTGEWMIAEADESDGSFSRLTPEIAIVTNIDNDHLDHYGDFSRLKKAFFDFAHRVPFFGSAVLCWTDSEVRETFRNFGKRAVRYGVYNNRAEAESAVIGAEGCDLAAWGSGEEGYEVLQATSAIEKGPITLGRYFMPSALPGRHNASNALAAISAAMETGLSFLECERGIRKFSGVDRRFQHKGSRSGVDVFDDYGHHPTEIRAVLSAFREKFKTRRLLVVFQPHRFSRTQLCWEQFVSCFEQADRLWLAEIYPAGEHEIPGVSSRALVDAIVSGPSVPRLGVSLASQAGSQPRAGVSFAWHTEVVNDLMKEVLPGDAIFTLGAGDVSKLADSILAALAQRGSND